MSPTALRIYGHWASQPFRSVAWLLRLNAVPFDKISVEPFKGDTRTPEFTAMFPLQLSPAMDDEGFRLSEGTAIATYLCKKHNLTQWSPVDLQTEARVNEYLSAHHSTTRKMTHKAFHPMMVSLLGKKEWTPELHASVKEESHKIALKFSDVFLKSDAFIAGSSPTVADLFAYAEVAQIPQVLGSDFAFTAAEFDRLNAWLAAMSALPYHDDVHRTVGKVGEMFQQKVLKK